MVARFAPGVWWGITPEIRMDRFIWEIRFVIAGPDSRYNPGRATISSDELEKFINIIKQSLDKARKLESMSIGGNFSRTFDDCYNPTIEVKSQSGSIQIHFWVSNNTKWKFSRILTISQLTSVLETLQTVESRGDRLVESLKLLHE